jgi:predicted small secreted protein
MVTDVRERGLLRLAFTLPMTRNCHGRTRNGNAVARQGNDDPLGSTTGAWRAARSARHPGSDTNLSRSKRMASNAMAAMIMLASFGALIALSGCNSVASAGRDVERAGQKVQDEAREVQRKI